MKGQWAQQVQERVGKSALVIITERTASRRSATMEESVTTRIRNRAKAHAASQPETPDEAAVPVDMPPETPGQSAEPLPRTTLFTMPPARVSQPHIPLSHEQRINRKRSRAQEQICLF